MDDPFINWINIDISYANSEKIGEVTEKLNLDSCKKAYLYHDVSGHWRFSLSFWNEEKQGTFQYIGRTIDIKNPLLQEIFKSDNIIAGRKFNDAGDIGIIVTERFMNLMNYNTEMAYLPMVFPAKEDVIVPIPLIAIVKELPGLNMFAVTPYFYNQRIEAVKNNPFSPENTKGLVLFTESDSVSANAFFNTIKTVAQQEFKELDPWVSIDTNNLSYKRGYNVSINFLPEPDSLQQLDDLYKKLCGNKMLNNIIFSRLYNFKLYEVGDEEYYHSIAVNFKNLDKIREFKNYLSKNYQIEIDMAQIESKENYNFVSKLTRFISIILIAFSALCITMFVSNVLVRHLDKIKMNIGTFKAFGIDNNTLLMIYINIINTFITISIFIALIFSGIIGTFGGIRLILKIFKQELEENQSYFQIINWWTLICIVAVFTISMLVIYFNAKRILKQTPGDLIYDR